VLLEKVPLAEGRIAVLGGGQIGCEAALFAAARGRQVTLLEKLPLLAMDMEIVSRNDMLEHLATAGVVARTHHAVVAVSAHVVHTRDGAGTEDSIPVEQVLLAVGMSPRTELGEALRERGIEYQAIGDCVRVREILSAVREGYEAALRI
jgi:pyruvate/2-oxoglutarate dehydrogenase complex dihydrolipoamide dehydrogenase (E3) component